MLRTVTRKRTIAEMLSDHEALWGGFDRIYDAFTPADWARKYGKDWTFADQPHHMAHFDRLMLRDRDDAPLHLG